MLYKVLYYEDIDYSIVVEVTKEDYIEHLWFKKFNVPFNIMTYLLYDKQGVYYKELENKWLHNEIDERTMNSESDFISYLNSKHKNEAIEEQMKEEEDEDPDEWWDNLDDEIKQNIRETYGG